MYINFDEMQAKGICCGGMRVLHVGACRLEEKELYNNAGITNIVWVEARHDIVQEMRRKHPQEKILQGCVGSVTGKNVTFDVHKNDMCSSVYRPTAHLKRMIKPVITEKLQLKTITLTDLFVKYGIQQPFDFVNVDVQGSELEALKGFPEAWWEHVQVVYVELNTKAQYEGACTPAELDSFLFAKQFTRKMEKWCSDNAGFGDAVYTRGS